jgi:hypothetical protein
MFTGLRTIKLILRKGLCIINKTFRLVSSMLPHSASPRRVEMRHKEASSTVWACLLCFTDSANTAAISRSSMKPLVMFASKFIDGGYHLTTELRDR